LKTDSAANGTLHQNLLHIFGQMHLIGSLPMLMVGNVSSCSRCS